MTVAGSGSKIVLTWLYTPIGWRGYSLALSYRVVKGGGSKGRGFPNIP